MTVLAFALSWLCGRYFVDYSFNALPMVEQNFSQCKTELARNTQTLIGFVPVKSMAVRLSEQLCADRTVSNQYGKVIIYFGSSMTEQVEFIAKGIADVILAKDIVVSAFKVKETHNYKPLVSFKAYNAYLIALREKPQLSKSYLLDKRIGLLDYPTSRSGHILPMQQFKILGLDVDNMNIVYGNTHSELRQLLLAGKVDMISSYWQAKDGQHLSEQYITPIAENIDGTKWYFKMSANNTELACALQSVLVADAVENQSGYFSEPNTYWQCERAPFNFIDRHHSDE
ncbi:putative membrane protein [Pseudoalteromonas luteoviolacea B = ATCC 29581]|nr:putative membrane protein [Pseudoalteromonas luteoviolacea B = ATCC 29581]